MAEWEHGPILALDLATACGWALGCPGETPKLGTFHIKGQTSAEKFHCLRTWLMSMCGWSELDDDSRQLYRLPGVKTPWAVGIEAALDPANSLRAGNGSKTLPFTLGIHAIAEETFFDLGIARVYSLSIDEHRKHLLGMSRFKGDKILDEKSGKFRERSGGEVAKEMCFRRVRALGFDPPDHNAAEAYAVWDRLVSVKAPGYGAQRVAALTARDVFK